MQIELFRMNPPAFLVPIHPLFTEEEIIYQLTSGLDVLSRIRQKVIHLKCLS